ncbi:MAG: LamG domain-containing protein, partial [Ignavibacteria bacterium]
MKMKLFTAVLICSASLSIQKGNAQMFWNQAAQFSGSALCYVSVPNSSSVDLTGSFSIEAWVNPANNFNKGVISKGGLLGTSLKYGIRINGSRVVIHTNGAPRLSSKTTSLIPVNTWTHIASTYNASTNEFRIYINGVLDSSSIVAGAAPTTNTDSLYVGISGASTPFNGKLDEVRLWNRELSSAEAGNYFRSTLGTSSGIYNGLILSMTFQNENSSGTKFTARDFSGKENNGNPRNVIAVDQSFAPLSTISINESVDLDGNEDY